MTLHVQQHAERHSLRRGISEWLDNACAAVQELTEKADKLQLVVLERRKELSEALETSRELKELWDELDSEYTHNSKLALDAAKSWELAVTVTNPAVMLAPVKRVQYERHGHNSFPGLSYLGSSPFGGFGHAGFQGHPLQHLEHLPYAEKSYFLG